MFAVLQYLIIGVMRLPVFANVSGGIAALMSPSAGYLYGCVLSAYLAIYFKISMLNAAIMGC